MKKIILLSSMIVLFIACSKNKSIPANAGKIKVELMVYNQPNEDIYDSFLIDISTLYFYRNELLEVLKDEGLPPYTYINLLDSSFIKGKNIQEFEKNALQLKEKKYGAVFETPEIPGYSDKEILSDTSFNGYNYKRFRIVTDSTYNVYYLHQTDTIYPFSIARNIEEDFGGILNRIDSYDKINDKFISLKMSVTDTIPKTIYAYLMEKHDERKQ